MKKNMIALSVFLTISAGVFSGCANEKTEERKPVNVTVQAAQNVSAEQNFSYSGTMEESESTPLSFSGIGTVSHVYVSEGEVVHKGQLLAELNSESSKNAYEMALAANKQAEDAYKRLLPMYKNGNLQEIKLVEVETGVQQTKAATAIAKKNLDDCKLYSTVNGIVGKKSIDAGMSVVPGLASITVVKIDKIFARVSVSENEISSIKTGAKANIRISALSNLECRGIVEEIGVLADPLAHTYKIKIGISNSNREIKPGMICNVTLEKSGSVKGLFIPSQAVTQDEQGRTFVYVIDTSKSTAVRKFVITGKLLKNGVEIIDGLVEGEQIVTSGQQKLVDNSLVHIIN